MHDCRGHNSYRIASISLGLHVPDMDIPVAFLGAWRCGGGCGLPGVDQSMSWLAEKPGSLESPWGLSEGLHSCLMFGNLQTQV